MKTENNGDQKGLATTNNKPATQNKPAVEKKTAGAKVPVGRTKKTIGRFTFSKLQIILISIFALLLIGAAIAMIIIMNGEQPAGPVNQTPIPYGQHAFITDNKNAYAISVDDIAKDADDDELSFVTDDGDTFTGQYNTAVISEKDIAVTPIPNAQPGTDIMTVMVTDGDKTVSIDLELIIVPTSEYQEPVETKDLDPVSSEVKFEVMSGEAVIIALGDLVTPTTDAEIVSVGDADLGDVYAGDFGEGVFTDKQITFTADVLSSESTESFVVVVTNGDDTVSVNVSVKVKIAEVSGITLFSSTVNRETYLSDPVILYGDEVADYTDTVTFQYSGTPLYGTVSIVDDILTYTPTSVGLDVLNVTITDGTSSEQFTLNVNVLADPIEMTKMFIPPAVISPSHPVTLTIDEIVSPNSAAGHTIITVEQLDHTDIVKYEAGQLALTLSINEEFVGPYVPDMATFFVITTDGVTTYHVTFTISYSPTP